MTLYLDESKNVINGPQKIKFFGNFKQTNFYSEVADFYRMLPWFKEKVNDIYINPLNENAKNLVIFQDSVKDSEGTIYYRPNKKYFELQIRATGRNQINEIHTIFYDKHEFKMKIGIITDQGLFQQNEDIFKAQVDFIKHWNGKNRDEEVQIILKSSVSKTEPICNFVFNFFKNIGFTDQKYIQQLLQIYQKHFGNEGKSFIDNLIDLLIYLKPKLSLVQNTNFIKRFKKLYYKPEIVPFLSEHEKLEEIFNDKFSPPETKQQVSEILFKQKVEMTKEWINMLLVNETVGFKRINTVKPNQSKPKYVDLPSWKKVCKNYTELIDKQDEDLVYVQEGKDIYGFTITDMFELIEEKDCANPYTKVIFPKDFVTRFLDTYYKPKKPPQKMDIVEGSITTVNALSILLEEQLCLLEKMCFFCKERKYKQNIYIESLNEIFYFCSTECMAKYNLNEFKNIQIDDDSNLE